MVLSSAEFLGLTLPIRATIKAELAAAVYAEEEGFEAEPEEIQQAVDAFRYERNLITAEETEGWFQKWEVSIDDLSGYLARLHWRERFADAEADIVRDFAPPDHEMENALWAEAVFGGAFREWAIACARRSAAWLEDAATKPAKVEMPRIEDIEACRTAFFERTGVNPGSLEGWLRRAGRDPIWFERMLALEARFRRTLDAFRTAVNPEQELLWKRMRLARIALERAVFPTAEAAREAMLCVTQDGQALSALAECAGVPDSHESRFLDEYPESIGRLCMSALPGEVLGPLENNGLWELCRVLEKTEPDAGDERVKRRLEKDAVDSAFDRLVARHVVWLIDPGETGENR